LLVTRIFSLSGPHINKHSTYVLPAIILSVLKRQAVTLRSARPVYRSYLSAADLVSVALAWLLAERRAEVSTLDAASREIVEVGELAELAAAHLGEAGIRIERPAIDFRHPDRYVGDPEALMRLAARFELRLSSMEQQIKDTAAFLAESERLAA
jgi:nucleoside-diphosphate-sugar epimerase